MWLITTIGFFSIVEKPEDKGAGMLTIRSRVKKDLDELRERCLPSLSPTTTKGGSDYPYRARTAREAFAVASLKLALDIDYSNFKSAVAVRQGHFRSQAYHDVWEVLNKLHSHEEEATKPGIGFKGAEDSPKAPPSKRASVSTPPTTISYGGVLFDDEGRVLLRKPTGEFDGYVWTFAKGKAKGRAGAESTALREVREETGIEAEIVTRIPGTFAGGTGANEYFLMRPTGRESQPDPEETAEIVWVKPEKAERLIGQTRNAIGRNRDQAVLAAACKVWEARRRSRGHRA